MPQILERAVSRIPAGRWGLAVSGGSDSIALLHLARRRQDLELHAIHLDHETRQGQSTADAQFVAQLCSSLSIPLTSARRSEIELRAADLPANVQARYRELRLILYRSAVQRHGLSGALQAHHADDQAETILMRLIRGTGIEGLCGIPETGQVAGIRILRPLLGVRKADLRSYLLDRQLSWREDASNASPKYQRNRVRQILAGRPALTAALLELRERFAELLRELEQLAPMTSDRVSGQQLLRLHPLVQLHAIREWSIARGASANDLTIELLERVRQMLEDMASSPAVCLPGGVEVRRRAGQLVMREPARPAPPPDAEALEDPS